MMTDATAEKAGKKIAEILNLKVTDGKVQTQYGEKNFIGLARMMEDLTKWQSTFEDTTGTYANENGTYKSGANG